MNAAVYVGVGWLLMTLCTAAATRLSLAHVMPDGAIVALVFVALHRDPLVVTLCAVALGYLTGQQALAPLGLHEAVCVIAGLVVYLTADNIAAGGARFFALASFGAVMLTHVLAYVLAAGFGVAAGFPSWATASLLPSALATAVLAYVGHGGLAAIEARLAPKDREELSWS